MKESEIYSKVSQTLREFETMEEIRPSADWNQSLMTRLAAAKQQRSEKVQPTWAVLAMLAFIVVNMGVMMAVIGNDGRSSYDRGNDLRAISNEFLINPTSANS